MRCTMHFKVDAVNHRKRKSKEKIRKFLWIMLSFSFSSTPPFLGMLHASCYVGFIPFQRIWHNGQSTVVYTCTRRGYRSMLCAAAIPLWDVGPSFLSFTTTVPREMVWKREENRKKTSKDLWRNLSSCCNYLCYLWKIGESQPQRTYCIARHNQWKSHFLKVLVFLPCYCAFNYY